jgi:hypothetical protein
MLPAHAMCRRPVVIHKGASEMHAKMKHPARRTWNGRALGLAGIPALIVLVLAVVAGSSARPTAVPNNTAPPTISGESKVGTTLKADNGNWSGTAPLTYTYQWRICDGNGGGCHDISGAMGNEYSLKAADAGNTVRVQVTAKNADGSATATSVPSAKIAAAAAPAPSPSSNGCSSNGGTVAASGVSAPARLNIDQFTVNPGTITHGTRTLSARFHVSACGGSVQGAMIYATAVPYGMFPAPNEQPTGSDGWATLDFQALPNGFPVSAKQRLLVMFVRARKAGDNLLGGISTRRLVSFKVAR